MSPSNIVEFYRESHHRIAEMFAMGYTPHMIMKKLGVSIRRLTLLYADESFQELIQYKSGEITERFEKDRDEYKETCVANKLKAELALSDKLDEHFEEDGEKLSAAFLNKISMDRADRFGYGKNSTVKLEAGLGDLLQKAINRSGVKIIEHNPQEAIPDLRDPTPKGVAPEAAPVLNARPLTAFKPGPAKPLKIRRIA